MTEQNEVVLPSRFKCILCGAAITQSIRGRRKHCDSCKKEIQNKRSRDCHYKRRAERAVHGQCTLCGVMKADAPELKIPFVEYLTSVNPQLIGVVTEEEVAIANTCRKCYIANRNKLLVARLARPKKVRVLVCPPGERKNRIRELGKERRLRIIAAKPEVCRHCLKEPRLPDKAWCEKCLSKSNEANLKRIHERRETGICIICKAPSGKKQLCNDCRQQQKVYSKRWWAKIRAERQEQGMCLRCGKVPAKPPSKNCEDCIKKTQDYLETKREAGLCQRCGKIPALPGKTQCPDCTHKTKVYSAKRYEAQKAKRAEKARLEKEQREKETTIL